MSRRWGAARITGVAVVALALWASAAPTLVYPLYISAWRLTTLETTMVFATYPAAMIVALLFIGNLADVVGGRRATLLGLGLLALGALGLLIAPNLGILLASRALMGLGVGAALGPATVEAGRSGDAADAHGGSIVTVATAAGLVIALVLGGIAVQWSPYPLRTEFALLLLAILAVVVLVWRTPNAARNRSAPWRFQPLTVPRPRGVFVAGALAMSAAYALGAVYLGVGAQYARDAVGSGDAAITGAILATSAIAIGATAIAARNVRPVASLALGAVALTVGQTLMVASGQTQLIWLLIVASVVGGAGYGLLFVAGIGIVITMAPSHHREAATSTAYLIAYFVQAVVALGVGAISTVHTVTAGLIAGSGSVLAIALLALLLLRTSRTRERVAPRSSAMATIPTQQGERP